MDCGSEVTVRPEGATGTYPRATPWAFTTTLNLRNLSKLACLLPSLVAVFQYEAHFLLAIHLDGERPGEADVAHVGQFFLGRKAVQG